MIFCRNESVNGWAHRGACCCSAPAPAVQFHTRQHACNIRDPQSEVSEPQRNLGSWAGRDAIVRNMSAVMHLSGNKYLAEETRDNGTQDPYQPSTTPDPGPRVQH